MNALERSIESMGKYRLLLVAGFAGAVLASIGTLTFLAASTLRASSSDDLSETIDAATQSYRFSFVEYEVAHLPNRWLYEVADWFDEPSDDEGETLERWFSTRSLTERKAAEILLERQLSQATGALGLETSLPLFSRVRIPWPPVDMQLSDPLHVLVVSRRDEVRMLGTVLLKSSVPREAYERIESIVEASGEWSAWVGRVGGVALYPASVVSSRTYFDTLRIMAHEWAHHYLSFYPLGLAYGRGSDMRTINETVADIVGDELGETAAALSRFSMPRPDDSQRVALLEATDPILRNLRIEVDSLLLAVRIEEAERRMEAARLQLLEMGRPFRRINQAFLAFRGSSAARPSSASPWGARLIQLRSDSDSLAEFLVAVREIGSPDDADALLPR